MTRAMALLRETAGHARATPWDNPGRPTCRAPPWLVGGQIVPNGAFRVPMRAVVATRRPIPAFGPDDPGRGGIGGIYGFRHARSRCCGRAHRKPERRAGRGGIHSPHTFLGAIRPLKPSCPDWSCVQSAGGIGRRSSADVGTRVPLVVSRSCGNIDQIRPVLCTGPPWKSALMKRK